MSSADAVGELSVKDEGVTMEWIIKDILSYTKENDSYYSPNFRVPGSEWCIQIYPNGHTEIKSVGWISVFLIRRNNSSHPKTVNFSFAAKKKDGTIKKINKYSEVFDEKKSGWGMPRFLERSELAPSSSLTIVCTLKVKDSIEYTSRINELCQNLKDMFVSQRGCDATLEVKDKTFSVHKSILTARSPVFAAMFEVDMKEKNTSSVEIDDCHPNAFNDFLAYLYSGEFENISSDTFELYRIAHKYDVKGLKSDCIRKLINNLSVKNVLEAAVLGHQFDETELINKTQEFFNESFDEIISSETWDSFSKNNFILSNRLLKNMAARRLKK